MPRNLKSPTGDSPLACAYRRAATVSILAATPDEARTDYRILAAIAARQYWMRQWEMHWKRARCKAAVNAGRHADMWLREVRRLSTGDNP